MYKPENITGGIHCKNTWDIMYTYVNVYQGLEVTNKSYTYDCYYVFFWGVPVVLEFVILLLDVHYTM